MVWGCVLCCEIFEGRGTMECLEVWIGNLRFGPWWSSVSKIFCNYSLGNILVVTLSLSFLYGLVFFHFFFSTKAVVYIYKNVCSLRKMFNSRLAWVLFGLFVASTWNSLEESLLNDSDLSLSSCALLLHSRLGFWNLIYRKPFPWLNGTGFDWISWRIYP